MIAWKVHTNLFTFFPSPRNNPKRYSRQILKEQMDDLKKERRHSSSAHHSHHHSTSSRMRIDSHRTNDSFDLGGKADNNNLDGVAEYAASDAETEEECCNDKVDRYCCCKPSTGAFKKMMDLSILKDGIFLMFAVSNFLTSIGFNVPYVYTVVSL